MSKKDERLFAPFPIEMDEHPKIIGLSDAAFRAIIEATFYARRMLTDGFLDERVVLRRWGQAVADELSSNDPQRPSWIRVEGGWQIHDFEKHHPLRAEIEAKRADLTAKRSQAGRKGAAKRWHGDSKPVATDGSQSQSQTQTQTEIPRLNNVSHLSEHAREQSTDDEGAIRAAILRGLGISNFPKLKSEIATHTGRDITDDQAASIISGILSKASGPVKSAQSYVLASIRDSWAELQQQLDEGIA